MLADLSDIWSETENRIYTRLNLSQNTFYFKFLLLLAPDFLVKESLIQTVFSWQGQGSI